MPRAHTMSSLSSGESLVGLCSDICVDLHVFKILEKQAWGAFQRRDRDEIPKLQGPILSDLSFVFCVASPKRSTGATGPMQLQPWMERWSLAMLLGMDVRQGDLNGCWGPVVPAYWNGVP